MKSLQKDFDRAAIRYLALRCTYWQHKTQRFAMQEVDAQRTLAHDALIAAFTAVLRNQGAKDPEMVKAHEAGRVAIGRWAITYAAKLLIETG